MTREEILEMLVANTEELVHEIGIYLHAKLEDDEELSGPEIPVFVLWLSISSSSSLKPSVNVALLCTSFVT